MAFGFIDFAKEALEASDRPLSVEEMWVTGCKQGLIKGFKCMAKQ